MAVSEKKIPITERTIGTFRHPIPVTVMGVIALIAVVITWLYNG
jgi:hypothetical protein